jgi:putative DNA primase/helicase
MSDNLPEDLRTLLTFKGEASSPLFIAFIEAAMRKNVDEVAIVKACLDQHFKDCSIFKHAQANGGEKYIKQQMMAIVNAPAQPGRKIIKMAKVGADTDKYWRLTEDAILENQCPVYVRGARLVQPLWCWNKTGERDVLVAELEYYTETQLADMVAHHAVIFQKRDYRLGWVDIDPPPAIIRALLGVHHYKLPTIIGITTSPTMRPDGSLLTEKGYDAQTKLWYKSSDNIQLPSILNEPSRKDAFAALDKLNDLLQEFPFDGEAPIGRNEAAEVRRSRRSVSRSAALAAIMTTVARGAFQSAVPLFIMTANKARTGKSFLVNTIGVIATGHVPVSSSGADKKEELEKRIETAAMSGRSIMHFNNLPNGMIVESERLAELCTEGQTRVRRLGKHEEVLCDCRATTIFLNGNNILLGSDLVFRAVTCRLNTQTEKPEEREFDYDPMEQVRVNRGEYIAAVFTIIRAFNAAGYPTPKADEMKRVAGFQEWSLFIQQSLIWLGMADPFGSMEEMLGMDPEQEKSRNIIGVLKGLLRVMRGNRFDVALCNKLAEEKNPSQSGLIYTYPELRDLMTNRGRIDGQYFGRLLMNMRDQIHNGWKISVVDVKSPTRQFELFGPQQEMAALMQPEGM